MVFATRPAMGPSSVTRLLFALLACLLCGCAGQWEVRRSTDADAAPPQALDLPAGSESSGARGSKQGRTHSLGTYPTLADFWNRRAYFQHLASFTTPSPEGTAGSVAFNIDQSVVVAADDTWYLFHREIFAAHRQTRCPTDPLRIRIALRSSIDQGKTWTREQLVVAPKAPLCQVTDGDAFYDDVDQRWHLLYQCLTPDDGWAICHASRTGPDPRGPWTENAANPVVVNRSLWSVIRPGAFDEGTPDIVERQADGRFIVTFHGVSAGPAGYDEGFRGVARASDHFTHWEVARSPEGELGPVFESAHTQSWKVPWEKTPKGGGHASTLKEGSYYYMVVEAADDSAFITRGQNWAHGLMRSHDPFARRWESAVANPIISSKRYRFYSTEKHQARGAIQYPRLFQDTHGSVYLLLGAEAVTDASEADPVAGHHLFQLSFTAPLLDFSFRAGGRGDAQPYFVRSDTISRGRGEAVGFDVSLLPTADGTHAVRFDQRSSRIELRGNADLLTSAGFRIVLDLSIDALPSGSEKSSFIAGSPGGFWLELYADGRLCFWLKPSNGEPKAACKAVPVGLYTTVTATYRRQSGELRLDLSGDMSDSAGATVEAGATPGTDGRVFDIGSAGPTTAGFYASPSMTLHRLRFYDR